MRASREGCVDQRDTLFEELILAIANESLFAGCSMASCRRIKAFAIEFGDESFAAPASARYSLQREKADIGI